MTVLGIIPARGGSKRFPGKNLAILVGKPLIAHTIEAARDSKVFDRVVVSTEDEAIARVALDWGIEVVRRPVSLATDDALLGPVCRHALLEVERRDGCRYEIEVLLQPTSPLRTAAHICAGTEILRRQDCDSVISVRPSLERLHRARIIVNGELRFLSSLERFGAILRPEDLPQIYYPNGALYITHRAILLERGAVYGDRIAPLIMSQEESIDIDTPLDLRQAKAVLLARGGQ
jgi:CMP-N-acetylneuraminic acid synthetase